MIEHRANDRFPMASTVKVPVVMAILDRVDRGIESLQRTIHFTRADLVPPYSRIAREYPTGGALDLGTICKYTISESDNTGVDLLFRILGGPSAVNAYVRRIGLPEVRVDRFERQLPHNASLNDPRDTVTPRTMAELMRRLVTHSPLSQRSTALLLQWMRATITGDNRLRAGVPHGWHVADKTGSYANVANDIGLLYPPKGSPIAIAVYAFGKDPDGAGPAIAQVASESIKRLR
jgi:beta-lactamase class A